MGFELDHLFVCTLPGAPEAKELLLFGLREGPPNHHPGQGTANRRFSFENAMLELFWVQDEKEARSERTGRTLLWERWSGRETTACPFGICLRPDGASKNPSPFPGWEYRPAYLPNPLAMYIGDGGLDEPMWIYLPFQRRAQRKRNFVEHPAGIRKITEVILTSPVSLHSAAAQTAVDFGILKTQPGKEPLLDIQFDGGRRQNLVDFRPRLPLIFRF